MSTLFKSLQSEIRNLKEALPQLRIRKFLKDMLLRNCISALPRSIPEVGLKKLQNCDFGPTHWSSHFSPGSGSVGIRNISFSGIRSGYFRMRIRYYFFGFGSTLKQINPDPKGSESDPAESC